MEGERSSPAWLTRSDQLDENVDMTEGRKQKANTIKDLPPNHPARMFIEVDRLPRVPLEKAEINLGLATPAPQLDLP